MSKEDKVSSTAYIVMCGYVSKFHNPRYKEYFSIVRASTNEKIFAELKNNFSKKFLKLIPNNILIKVNDTLGLPGLTDHYVFRKKYIEDETVKLLQKDYEQVFNIGAGYDSLCIGLAEKYPNKHFFELDLSQLSMDIKRKVAEKQFVKDNFFNKKCNISEDCFKSPEKLFDNYDSSKKTVFIIEGLLVYLDREVIERVFENIKSNSASGSKIIFTNVEHNKNYKPRLISMKKVMAVLNEKLKSVLSRDEIEKLLRSKGLKLEKERTYLDMQDDFHTSSFSGKYYADYVENIIISSTN